VTGKGWREIDGQLHNFIMMAVNIMILVGLFRRRGTRQLNRKVSYEERWKRDGTMENKEEGYTIGRDTTLP